MKPHWTKNFFRPISDLFPELATPGGLLGHRINDDDSRLGYTPKNPSRGSVLGSAPTNIIGAVNDYVTLLMEQKELILFAYRERILRQIATNVPMGEPFVLFFHDQGTDHEVVVVLLGATDASMPGYGMAEQYGKSSHNVTVAGVGTNPGKPKLGGNLFYEGWDRKVGIASVAGGESLTPAQQASPFIRSEPKGEGARDVLRDGGPLPARGDLDQDHPMYRDPRGLA